MKPADPRPNARPRQSLNQFKESPFGPDPQDDPRGSMVALQNMVAAEDLSVVFQPIVHVDTFRVFAYEALVRCRAPKYANPATLFEHAVEAGCVGRLGRMIREIAVPLCAGHPLFLNLHPTELQERWVVRPDDPMFFHDQDVYLEITESVPFAYFDLCRDVLREIRSRGNFFLVVDDLGAGYSNLKRVADLEPRVVKLDRSLVMNLTAGSSQQRLVENIVRLCADMGALIVAEGIETVEEWDALRHTGVDLAQGYLFARPGYPLPEVRIPPALSPGRPSFAPPGVRPSPDPAPRRPSAPPGRDTRTPVSLSPVNLTEAVRGRDTRTPVSLSPVNLTEAVRGRDTRTPVSLSPVNLTEAARAHSSRAPAPPPAPEPAGRASLDPFVPAEPRRR
ncbi:MAG: EAL domain-containing protein [Polyangiales bacterium]